MNKNALFLALGLAMAAVTGASHAADTTNMNVTASVTATCKFLAAPDAAFGALDPAAGSNVTATSGVQFWCSKGAAYTLGTGNGSNYDTTNSVRRMKGPGATDFIPYTLSPVTSTGTGTGKSSPITVTVTGSVLGTDYINASVGSYSDIVQLTINP